MEKKDKPQRFGALDIEKRRKRIAAMQARVDKNAEN
jgi:hypothetical protein